MEKESERERKKMAYDGNSIQRRYDLAVLHSAAVAAASGSALQIILCNWLSPARAIELLAPRDARLSFCAFSTAAQPPRRRVYVL